jgi:DNA-binding Lrp family transcriptional regulator
MSNMKETRLDENDRELLRALKKDSRATVAELSKALGMPRSTVHERIIRMRKAGIIKRFTIEEDYRKTGLPTMAFALASYDPQQKADQHEVAKEVSKIPGVLGVYIISGEWDMLIKIRGKSIEDIGMTVLNRIRNVKGVLKTYTMSCFEIVREEL